MACRASAWGPSGLKIDSEVISSNGNCTVRANCGDCHRVSVKNHFLMPYQIEIEAECKSANVRYDGPAGPQAKWDESFVVPGSPGQNKIGEAAAQSDLTSTGAAPYQNIETKITWQGCDPNYLAVAQTLTAQVHTQ